MTEVLATGHTIKRYLLFLPTNTHFVYSQRDGQAELACSLKPWQYIWVVTSIGTNLTLLMCAMTLPLSHAAVFRSETGKTLKTWDVRAYTTVQCYLSVLWACSWTVTVKTNTKLCTLEAIPLICIHADHGLLHAITSHKIHQVKM